MIESNVNNQTSAAMRQAQSQDMRSFQNIRANDENAVEEQASSSPVSVAGAEAAAAVSTQPSDVVTRLGETTEQVPLYESNRTAGTIIRPAIEVAQNTASAAEVSTQAAREREDVAVAVKESTEGASPATGQSTGSADAQNLV
ncbi:MAG: hypothetical protein IBX50_05185 [Marinospirillum sp.]|uniref:hypothetical protein n=1 Tax=Marinospirillum sp. TaxID=2183934 RepID=UPI001A0EE5DC|nr:hypothetical protein [Marinospirillum sp.]MBE0506101.1 hypothetical protein [Marinospirillum sp.]